MRLSALATHIPSDRIETEAIVKAANGSLAEARVFRRMFGMDSVAATPVKEGLVDQFHRIVDDLSDAHGTSLPDALIYVRGQPLQYCPNGSPAQTLSQSHPFLSEVQRHYEVDQHNCSGLFWAIDMARSLLDAQMARCVAVIGGDCHINLPLANRYVPGCTLMGDSFCGMVLDHQPGSMQLSQTTLKTHTEFSFGRSGTLSDMGAFFAAHGNIVKSALDHAGFDWNADTPLLPHNVNKLAWQSFSRETGLAPDRIRLNLLPDIGHCYTCDPFLLLNQERAKVANRASHAMLLSVGMGGFVGACHVHGVDHATQSKTETSPSLPRSMSKEAASCMPANLS